MNIVVSGTVGVGKSTISEMLSWVLNYKLQLEPAETNPYLEDYYKDTKNFAFKMQIYMLMVRSKQLKTMVNEDNIVFDRSILEDPVFVEVLKEQGNFNDVDYNTYYDFFNNVLKSSLYFDPKLKPDLIVYLRAKTQTAIDRITQRGRKSELDVDFEYWDLLNKKYDEWYEKNKDILPFLVIDVDNKNPQNILKIIIEKVNELEKEESILKKKIILTTQN